MERKSELDLLRTISMMGVVLLHVLGTIKSVSGGTDYEYIVKILLAVASCSVNVFALLSGYLKIKSRIRFSSIVNIWITTFFWCFVLTIIAHFMLADMSIKQYVGYIFPYVIDRLWYITCYSFLFFMMPYLNKLMVALDKKQVQTLLVILFVLMSIVTTFGIRDSFHVVSTGYSAMWLVYLYILGGYLRLYGFSKKLSKCSIVFILVFSTLLIVLSTTLIEYILVHFGFSGQRDLVNILYRYSSPFVLVNSVLILWLFVEYIRVKKVVWQKIIGWMSKVSLGIYVIHAHPFCLDYLFTHEHFGFIMSAGVIGCGIQVLLVVFVVYILCGIAEHLREKLFVKTKIIVFINFIGDKGDALLKWNNK